MSQLELFRGEVNPDEAPAGYYAVSKGGFSGGENICNFCDWRAQCNDEATDFLAYGHRCMGYAVVAFRDGKTYHRDDGRSVVFKKRATAEDSSAATSGS